ncbi:ferric reductase-like transmembrane domain-containing protein [Chroococcidiopsis sp. FACHB-1243]|uniref:ferric reductase-like transmembrane domain-containing protein n=1 Tax=Chroococcidiopsis sp. [FACHB-1243] TaxID=2692781 RepID=UPI0017809A85|nr:ferric reductase-like transmembrane domain-containing protein [Chroococcidiopsis sp. [FACHB-1243]]MBD2309676.1 ferric reductase-like transmembrane domain-containing protein [Chroococcidiopsis sp. [FACHB-1243]]
MFVLDSFPLPNFLGFLALVSYIVTLLPTILRIVFPKTKETGIPKWLLKHRRLIGVIAFFLALAHGYLLVEKRQLDFSDPKTFWVYVQGISTFTIFTILAITSNDWSVRKLKKNWKQLHKLTYLAMFLLTWHIWDKMAGHWTYLTPIGIASSAGIIVLFLIRLQLERQGQQQKDLSKASSAKIARQRR